MQVVQAFYVSDEVIVQVEVVEVRRDLGWEGDSRYLILPEAQSLFRVILTESSVRSLGRYIYLNLGKPFQMQRWNGNYATMHEVDFLNPVNPTKSRNTTQPNSEHTSVSGSSSSSRSAQVIP